MRHRKTSMKVSWILLTALLLLIIFPAGIAGAETIPVTGVSINPSYLSLNAAGYQSQLTAVITPSNASNKAVTWYTDKPSVASIDQNGVVTPQGGGTANIMVYTQDGGYEAYCRVDVIGSTNPVRVTGVTLNKESITMAAGSGTETLTATVSPSTAYNKEVQWFSSNDYIAYVDQNGVVWPNSYGTATITVLTVDGDYTDTCQVNVTSTTSVPVTGISLNKNSLSLNVGAEETLIANLTPSNATNKIINWTSSNDAVARVGPNGLVVAYGPGTATIKAQSVDGGFIDTCEVTVLPAPIAVTGVTVSPTALNLPVGATSTLTTAVLPSNATNKSVAWSSSNTAVASVNNGVVTAVGLGSATISVKTVDGGYTANCGITVTAPVVKVTGVTINKTFTTLKKGNKMTLVATVKPTNATNKNVTWSSSNTSIATVSSTGVVTALKSGFVTIKATTIDGNYSAKCTVWVTLF